MVLVHDCFLEAIYMTANKKYMKNKLRISVSKYPMLDLSKNVYVMPAPTLATIPSYGRPITKNK